MNYPIILSLSEVCDKKNRLKSVDIWLEYKAVDDIYKYCQSTDPKRVGHPSHPIFRKQKFSLMNFFFQQHS